MRKAPNVHPLRLNTKSDLLKELQSFQFQSCQPSEFLEELPVRVNFIVCMFACLIQETGLLLIAIPKVRKLSSCIIQFKVIFNFLGKVCIPPVLSVSLGMQSSYTNC